MCLEKYYQEEAVQSLDSKKDIYSRMDTNQQGMQRKHRPDSMFHYPFADEYGSVPDVLLAPPEVQPKLLEMGGPARKRFVERVFDEMRLDRNGIRVSDLPEALYRVGITISTKLRRLLERTRSNLVNGPINLSDEKEDGREDVNPIMHQYMEKHVPLPLWKSLVRNFLVLIKQGRDAREVVQLFPMCLSDCRLAPQEQLMQRSNQNAKAEDDDYFESLSDYDNIFGENLDTNDRNQGDADNFDEVDAVLRKAKAMKARQDERKMVKSKHQLSKTGRAGHNDRSGSRERESSLEKQQRALAKQTHDHYKKVKGIPSRLGEVIKHDRDVFQHHRKESDKAAFEMIAKQRARHFMASSTPPVGFDNPIYRVDGRSLNARHQVDKQKESNRKAAYYHDLNSGAAALDIADGFLSSSIGQEMMSLTGSELDDDMSLSPPEALERAKAMLGIPSNRVKEHSVQLDQQFIHSTRANRNANVVVNSSNRPGPPQNIPEILDQHPSAKHDTIHKFITYRDRQIEQKLDEQSKHLYGSNWEIDGHPSVKKNCGWVADFGPAHTHAFYRGPERHQISLSSSGRGVHVPIPTSSNETKNDMSIYTELDPGLGRIAFAATDNSVSSTSFDLAIAGAGADVRTGMYDDDSLSNSNNIDEDDVLIEKFQDTVSLREVVKNNNTSN